MVVREGLCSQASSPKVLGWRIAWSQVVSFATGWFKGDDCKHDGVACITKEPSTFVQTRRMTESFEALPKTVLMQRRFSDCQIVWGKARLTASRASKHPRGRSDNVRHLKGFPPSARLILPGPRPQPGYICQSLFHQTISFQWDQSQPLRLSLTRLRLDDAPALGKKTASYTTSELMRTVRDQCSGK